MDGASWQDNWLFRRGTVGRERLAAPVAMLVPNPASPMAARSRVRVGDVEVDQLSDLSEQPSSEVSSPWSDDNEEQDQHVTTSQLSPGPLASMESSGQRDLEHTEYAVAAPTWTKHGEAAGSPSFMEAPPDVVLAQEGHPVVLQCRVRGQRPVDVAWFRRALPAAVSLGEERVEETHIGGSRHMLTLYQLRREDAATFSCVAINCKGETWKTFSLVIERESILSVLIDLF